MHCLNPTLWSVMWRAAPWICVSNSNGVTLHGILCVSSSRTARYFIKTSDIEVNHEANVGHYLLWFLAPSQLLFWASLFTVLFLLSQLTFFTRLRKPHHHLKTNIGQAFLVAQWGWERWSLLGHANRLFTILKLHSSTTRDAYFQDSVLSFPESSWNAQLQKA